MIRRSACSPSSRRPSGARTGSREYIRAPTYSAPSSYAKRTSIGSVGGAPSTGSFWTKSVTAGASPPGLLVETAVEPNRVGGDPHRAGLLAGLGRHLCLGNRGRENYQGEVIKTGGSAQEASVS